LLWSVHSIFRTINNGNTWQQYQVDSSGNYPIVSFRFMNPDTGYFTAWNGMSFSQPTLTGWTFDRGATWTIDSTQPNTAFFPVTTYFASTTFGFALTWNNSSIYRTTDAGRTWQEEKFSSFAPLMDISAVGKTVVGGGNSGRLMVSNDSGITWQDLTPPAQIQLTFVKYITNNLVAAIGNGSELFLSSDSCKTWTKHDMPSGLNVTIAFGDSLNCWIADDSSRIFHSSDLGATWTAQKELDYLNPPSTLDPPLFGISFFGDSTGCAVGGNGFITASTNGGGTWTTRTSNTSKNLYGIFVASSKKAWAVGQSGTIVTTSDAFNSWSAQTCPVATTLRSVAFSDTLNGYILGDGGTILKTTDGGATWKVQPSPGTSLNAFKFLDTGEGWVAADSGKIFKTVDGGNTWLSQNSGVQSSLTSVDFTDRLHGVAVGGSGVVLVTKNGGVTAVSERTIASVPGSPTLQQNYPNPFNPSTTINYSLPANSRVVLKVYDLLGREVRTLVDEKQNAGYHNVTFQAAGLPSGVYFYRLQAGTYSETKKLLLLK
ncbi:MAG: YCF48-related protein, partial [Bacteroidota bacterium]